MSIRRRLYGDGSRGAGAGSLERTGGNKSKTARELGVTRKTLAEKMSRIGLD